MMKMGGGLMAVVLMPGAAWACACGCGVFDVATSSMFPEGSGGTAFVNYMKGNQLVAPALFKVGLSYMF